MMLELIQKIDRKMGQPDRRPVVLVTCCVVYAVFSLPLYLLLGSIHYAFMPWNLFLSLLPVAFAYLIRHSVRKKQCALSCVFAILWLFFFPNAPYVITDFVHIYAFFSRVQSGRAQDIKTWFDLIYLAMGVLLGTLAGLISLRLLHGLLIAHRGRLAGHLALCAVCLLSGFGIYIGRFLRFNSWDILRPVHLISGVVSQLDRFALLFTLLIAGYILLTYGLFCLFVKEDFQRQPPVPPHQP